MQLIFILLLIIFICLSRDHIDQLNNQQCLIQIRIMNTKIEQRGFQMPSCQQIAQQYYQYIAAIKKHQDKDQGLDSDQIFYSDDLYEESNYQQHQNYKDQEYIDQVKIQWKEMNEIPVKKIDRMHRRKGNKQRKIRTTITRERLQKMNQAFHQYFQTKQKGNNPSYSLRQIGQRLQLGYSTILHKFRQYRQNRRVKESVLLLSKQKKRKYKKSINIERAIEQALYQRPFFTAIELSKYLYRTRNIMLSRSIISRHLQDMGYSFNNMRNLTMEKNNPKYISIRKNFANIMDNNVEVTSPLIFIDEFAFCINLFKKHFTNVGKPTISRRGERNQEDYVSLMIAADKDKIYHYQIKHGFFTKDQFKDLIRNLYIQFYDSSQEISNIIDKPVLLTDTNYIHYDSNPLYEQSDSIDQVIKRCGFIRYFLPPGSPQLNPLLSIFIKIKESLGKQERMEKSLLVSLIKRQMITICKQSIEHYFKQLPSWIEKARNEEQF